MLRLIRKSIHEHIRTGLSTDEQWSGPDDGLIWCWERGRQKRDEDPQLADRAATGELVQLAWRRQSKQYLATWQGIRNEDLDINLDDGRVLACSKDGKRYKFGPYA
jgi:hypothetical protein